MTGEPRLPWVALDLFWEWIATDGYEALEANHHADAERLWQTADALTRSFDQDDPRRAATLSNRATVLAGGGDGCAAAALYREALALWTKTPDWVARMDVVLPARSSSFHMRLEQRHGDNLKALRRHIQTGLAAAGEAATRANLARLLLADGNATDAEFLTVSAVEQRATGIGHRDMGLARICEARAACLDALGRAGEAETLRAQASGIRKNPSSPGPLRLKKESGVKMTDERRLTAAAYLTISLNSTT